MLMMLYKKNEDDKKDEESDIIGCWFYSVRSDGPPLSKDLLS